MVRIFCFPPLLATATIVYVASWTIFETHGSIATYFGVSESQLMCLYIQTWMFPGSWSPVPVRFSPWLLGDFPYLRAEEGSPDKKK